MSDISYNQAILIFANAGLAALAGSADTSSSLKTPAGESHFLCSWMVTALKKRSFSKLLADDLTFWIRQARSMGANAELKLLLQKISQQYTYIADKQQGLGLSLKTMLTELEGSNWLTITDQEVTQKLKLNGDGRSSIIISEEQLTQRIVGGELIKPIMLYVRAPEQEFAEIAYKHNLLIGSGKKKTSLIKHHKPYWIWPKNLQPALTVLLPLSHP